MNVFGKPKGYLLIAVVSGLTVLLFPTFALYSTFPQVAWYWWAFSYLAIWLSLIYIAYHISTKHRLTIDSDNGVIEQRGYKDFRLTLSEIRNCKVTRHALDNTVSFDVEFALADGAVRIDPDFLSHEIQGTKIINLLQQMMGEPLMHRDTPPKKET